MSFSLGDYVTVNDRLKAALEKFPDLRVVETPADRWQRQAGSISSKFR
jgi:hypothetical protein